MLRTKCIKNLKRHTARSTLSTQWRSQGVSHGDRSPPMDCVIYLFYFFNSDLIYDNIMRVRDERYTVRLYEHPLRLKTTTRANNKSLI